ncbi:hypothetical protein D9619_007826 [Psilocybe cf. subviscida]|uniref:Uncharacterized protein n=1 Tax=Psilocybe cf. subviscida TaxID=2480587 RepID=A0A8H5AVZ4_9AGAR|nr:hypothetical protein D9619_007826 [Psilocybe cf. subviscida]
MQARCDSLKDFRSRRGIDEDSTSKRSLSEKQYFLSTLNPSSPSAAPQEVLDVSEEPEVLLSCRVRTDVLVPMRYSADQRFPPNTRGVLYYGPSKRQRHILFRLCDSVADFSRGSDLLKSNGHKWTISLEHMITRIGRFRPLLDIIAEDHPLSAVDIEEILSKRRIITTLSPQELEAKGQRVFDIFNLPSFLPLFSIQHESSHRVVNSTCAPNTIGESRFRLCSDIASFAAGSDLRLPSGLPWCITSDQLISMPYFSVIREQLLHEGLFKQPLPLYADASTIPIICNLNQPFIVDFSKLRIYLCFKPTPDSDVSQMVGLYLFSTRFSSFYTGRAVVRLEKFTSAYLLGRKMTRKPLVALRFLEFLTPVEAKPNAGLSPLRVPEVGQLLIRRTQGGAYAPWGHAPLDATLYEQLSKLTERSPASQ